MQIKILIALLLVIFTVQSLKIEENAHEGIGSALLGYGWGRNRLGLGRGWRRGFGFGSPFGYGGYGGFGGYGGYGYKHNDAVEE